MKPTTLKFKSINTKITFLIFSLIFLGCKTKTKNEVVDNEKKVKPIRVIRQAAEFEEQDAVWLIWPPSNHIKRLNNDEVTLNIVKSIADYVKVNITVKSDSVFNAVISKVPENLISEGKVNVQKIASEQIWIRDMGPNFVELSNGKKGIVDFNFDGWGYVPHNVMDDETIAMEKFDELVANKLDFEIISTNLYSEGGDREVNGKGTLMVVEAVELNRNPEKTKKEIENEYKRVLGVTNVIWLNKGVYEDDHSFKGPINVINNQKAYTVFTTGGHIDEFARFADANTILLAEVPKEDLGEPVADENKKRLDVNYQILINAKDQDGNPFKIIRVPTPHTLLGKMNPGDPVYDGLSTLDYTDGSSFPKGKPITAIAATSYLNFLITNHVIVGQKYWKKGLSLKIKERDADVKKILQSTFPNREIIMIDPLAINWGGGGVHCITMQQPK